MQPQARGLGPLIWQMHSFCPVQQRRSEIVHVATEWIASIYSFATGLRSLFSPLL